MIWGYNHSDAYIDTVLWLSNEVRSPTPEPIHASGAKKRRAHKPAPHKPSHGTTKGKHHPKG